MSAHDKAIVAGLIRRCEESYCDEAIDAAAALTALARERDDLKERWFQSNRDLHAAWRRAEAERQQNEIGAPVIGKAATVAAESTAPAGGPEAGTPADVAELIKKWRSCEGQQVEYVGDEMADLLAALARERVAIAEDYAALLKYCGVASIMELRDGYLSLKEAVEEWLPTFQDFCQIPELTSGERRDLTSACDALRAALTAKGDGT